MKEIPTFGECLTEIMRKKHISVSDLARRMNYRSRTSLSRLLRDETRYDSIEDFMNRIEPVSAWLLTAEEMTRLKAAMQVSRLGRARYRAYENIWRLVGEPKPSALPVPLQCYGSGKAATLQELTEVWHESQALELLLINSGCDQLFRELEKLLRSRPDFPCRISHYLLVRNSPGAMAQQLGALMGIFHDPRYQGYYRTWEQEGSYLSDSIQNNIAVATGIRADGQPFMHILGIQEDGPNLLYENNQALDFMNFFRHSTESFYKGVQPLKTEYPEQELIEGLIVICRRYLNCELDRTTYCLAPDICFELIPYEILKKVMFDSALSECDEQTPQAAELIDIHRMRYENIRRKKKKTVFMFTWEGLKKFARTGRTTDHVAGMRTFTPQERITILKDVVEQCRSNVYLSVYILRTDTKVRGMTLTTHEGLGTYLLDSNTQYDVVRGHSEAFILMPEFAATLSDFFRDELIEKHTYSEAESIDMLRTLIVSITD